MAETWTILRVLDWTKDFFESKGIESARLDAELIIAHVLKLQRVMLYAHFDRPLDANELTGIRELVKRRANQEPVAYLLESKEFWSMELHVNSAVLVPRPDTEVLVEVCLKKLKGRQEPYIADVGTGSGCIALALAQDIKDAIICGFDVSSDAIKTARHNVALHNLSDRVTIIESDLLSDPSASPKKYDLIAANLPYIPSEDIETLAAEVKDHEPRLALDGGADGLDLIRRLISSSCKHLESNGFLVLEAGYNQLDALENLMDAAGFDAIEITKDYAGHPRVCSGTWPN